MEVSALDARTDLEHCAVREIARELRRRSGALELALDEQWDYGWGGWRARLSSELLECGRGCDGLWWSGEKGVDLEFGFADRTAFANTNASACPGEPLQFTGFLFNLPLSAAEGHHSDARLVFVIEHTENYFTEVLEVRVRLDLARARK